MAVVSYWTNADGLRVRFGAHDSQNSRLGASVSGENVKTVVAEFVYNDLPAPGGAGVLDQVYLPAGAYVISTTFQVDTAFAGGTSLQVGTEQADGTDIDLDGFHTDAQLVTASMTAFRGKDDQIEKNTSRTADNTQRMVDKLDAMDSPDFEVVESF